MAKGWLRDSLKMGVDRTVTFVVLGVTVMGEMRDFRLLETYSLSPSQIKRADALLISSVDAMNYDYVMTVREEIAKRNGWLK